MFAKPYKVFNGRKHKRLKANYLIKFQPVNAQTEPWLSNLKDISAGGVRFWSNQALEKGVVLRLSVLIPPLNMTLNALGRAVQVRRTRKFPIYYTSVSFIELNTDQQDTLNQFIEEMLVRDPAGAVPSPVFKRSPASI